MQSSRRMQKNTMYRFAALRRLVWSSSLLLAASCLAQDLRSNRWVQVSRDPLGGAAHKARMELEASTGFHFAHLLGAQHRQRTIMHSSTEDDRGPHPDLNIPFDPGNIRLSNSRA